MAFNLGGKEMIFPLRTLTLILMFLALSQAAPAQKNEIKIEMVTAGEGAVPGQMLYAFVVGVSDRFLPPIPIDRFEVAVTQDGVARQAKVRSVAFAFMNPRVPSTQALSRSDKLPDPSDQLNGAKPCQLVMFTVPLGLHAGDANVVVVYLGKRSNEFTFKIVNRLPVPRIDMVVGVPTTSSRPTPPTADDLKQARPELRLERGRDTEILVHPMIDPEVPGAGVQVTFKQGSLIKSVSAKVTRREATESDGNTVAFAPIRYRITVRAPEELELGPARVEARLSLNGQISEPGSSDVLITDSMGSAGNVDPFKPRLTNVGEQRIGIGQAIRVAIDAKWLEPDPAAALIVIEQGSKRIELKPEMNSATRRTRFSEMTGALLAARVEDDITGKVTVRVYNPARGDQNGLSDGIPIEIVDEVVPPLAIKVGEASKQDLALLRALRNESLKQGREFHEYDPDARYVTIQAIGLDYNPNFVRIKFEQGGRQFTLKYEDYSLTMGDRLVVRVPDAIKAGNVQLTIQNSGWDRLSDPVITTVEITELAKKASD